MQSKCNILFVGTGMDYWLRRETSNRTNIKLSNGNQPIVINQGTKVFSESESEGEGEGEDDSETCTFNTCDVYCPAYKFDEVVSYIKHPDVVAINYSVYDDTLLFATIVSWISNIAKHWPDAKLILVGNVYNHQVDMGAFQQGMHMTKIGNHVSITYNGLPIGEQRDNVRQVSRQQGTDLADRLSNIPFFEIDGQQSIDNMFKYCVQHFSSPVVVLPPDRQRGEDVDSVSNMLKAFFK